MGAHAELLTLFKYKTWANAILCGEFAKLNPEDHPSEQREAIRLLNHIYVVDRIFAAHLSGEKHRYTGTNTPETPSFEELCAALTESDRWYIGYVGAISPDLLPQMLPFTFTDGAAGCMSREEMLVHVATHGDYHRGALGRLLPPLAVPPLTDYLHTTDPHRCEPS